jgi:hypothetical protein
MKLPDAKPASLTTSPERWCKTGVAASLGQARRSEPHCGRVLGEVVFLAVPAKRLSAALGPWKSRWADEDL